MESNKRRIFLLPLLLTGLAAMLGGCAQNAAYHVLPGEAGNCRCTC